MIRYYKLFDLLKRRGKKLSDLRNILSSSTVAKLNKGQYISGEAIDKICLYLNCQPGDIMEVIEVENVDHRTQLWYKPEIINDNPDITVVETYAKFTGQKPQLLNKEINMNKE